MAGIRVLGLGYAHGEHSISNDEMKKFVDTSDEWIRKKTGIRSRYFTDGMNADMAEKAALTALSDAGISIEEAKKEIGVIIVCTHTPDWKTPNVSNEICGRLEISEDCFALDVNSACSGFVYGMKVAEGVIDSQRGKYALVIGSEKMSPILDMTDRGTCVLFGDGAGAILFERDKSKACDFVTGCIPDNTAIRVNPYVTMKGQEVYRFAVSKVPECINKLLEKTGLTSDDIDYYVCHQANLRILDSTANKLGVSEEKFFKNIYNYGNTSGASVAIALGEMKAKGLIHEGMKLVCVGFGSGLTYGAMLLTI